jgi:ribosomal protein S4
VKKEDIISIKENKKKKNIFKELSNQLKGHKAPSWLELDKEKLEAKSVGQPSLEEVKPPAEISLIFEFYSR